MSSTSDKIHQPIVPPANVVNEDPRGKLSDKEQELYDLVLAHFTPGGYSIPGLEKGELREEELFWLSRECLLRYLRATKWKSATAAIERLEATLKWRRDYGLYDLITPEYVEPEAVTGKEVLFGYDSHGRPAFYMFPSRQNTDDPPRQIQFTVWALERATDLMGPGVETVDLMINYGDKAKNPSFSTARTVAGILQDHYPERLGLALIMNVPFILNAFYKMISPFLDPVSREKMRFNPEIFKDEIFAPDMVMSEWWGGSCDFEYVHEKYWSALVRLCESRRNAWLESWRSLGGRVGISEWDYKRTANLQTEIDAKQQE